MTFTVNMFLSCILYRDAGPGCDRTVCKWVDSYHGYHICFRTFSFGDAVALLSFISRKLLIIRLP